MYILYALRCVYCIQLCVHESSVPVFQFGLRMRMWRILAFTLWVLYYNKYCFQCITITNLEYDYSVYIRLLQLKISEFIIAVCVASVVKNTMHVLYAVVFDLFPYEFHCLFEKNN